MATDEFWLLFAVFIRQAPSISWTSILKLLEQLKFVDECENLNVFSTVVSCLVSSGMELSRYDRWGLCTEILKRALVSTCEVDVRNSIPTAKRVVAHRSLDFIFAFKSASASRRGFQISDPSNMMCVIEEEICWSLCEEPRLLEYVFLEDIVSGVGRLSYFVLHGLGCRDSQTRLQALRLVVACSFNSLRCFINLLPLLSIALYYEAYETREYVLAALLDLIYIHHEAIELESVQQFFIPFFYAPTHQMQHIAVTGCGRLLLYDCFPNATEFLLAQMFERDGISSLEGRTPCCDTLSRFFLVYSSDKCLHQDEIANTIVFMIMEKIKEGVIYVELHNNSIRDNPYRKEAAQMLRRSMQSALSIADRHILNSVTEALSVNLNSQLGISGLNRRICKQWLIELAILT